MHTDAAWLIFDREPEADDLILVCLHFAGGTAALYREWQRHAPAGIAICRVQMPGHGTRLCEPLLTDMPSVVDALMHAIRPWSRYRFAVFGHSMGGVIAAEWTLRLQDEGGFTPVRLFISASEPPHRSWRPACRNAPAETFRRLLSANGGIPGEVLRNEELMGIFEPILRADYTLLETWSPRPVRPIRVPIIAFAGAGDHVVPREVVSRWQLYAAASWRLNTVPGGHFFIQTHAALIRGMVFDELQSVTEEERLCTI